MQERHFCTTAAFQQSRVTGRLGGCSAEYGRRISPPHSCHDNGRLQRFDPSERVEEAQARRVTGPCLGEENGELYDTVSTSTAGGWQRQETPIMELDRVRNLFFNQL